MPERLFPQEECMSSPSREGNIPIFSSIRHENLFAKVGFDYRAAFINYMTSVLKMLSEGQALEFRDVLQSHDECSDAMYAFEMQFGEHMVYGYYIPEYSVTSDHYHRNSDMRERYYIVRGEMYLQNGDRFGLIRKEGEVVEAPNRHHGETAEQGAFVIVVLENSVDVPSHQRHSDRRRPVNRFKIAA